MIMNVVNDDDATATTFPGIFLLSHFFLSTVAMSSTLSSGWDRQGCFGPVTSSATRHFFFFLMGLFLSLGNLTAFLVLFFTRMEYYSTNKVYRERREDE